MRASSKWSRDTKNIIISISECFRSATESGPSDILKLYNTSNSLMNISPRILANSPDTRFTLKVVGAKQCLSSDGTCLFYTCFTHVLYIFYTCFTHVLYMFYTCLIHILHMFYTCFTHVLYMFYTCFIWVLLTFYICFPGAM